MTPQRQLVLDAVRELGHATPEQVCRTVQNTAPTVNITTVYRALDLLEELALLRHTQIGQGPPTYSPEEHEHLHLACEHCGRLDEVPRDVVGGLAGTLRERYGFELDASHLALPGCCADCARRGSGPSEAEPRGES